MAQRILAEGCVATVVTKDPLEMAIEEYRPLIRRKISLFHYLWNRWRQTLEELVVEFIGVKLQHLLDSYPDPRDFKRCLGRTIERWVFRKEEQHQMLPGTVSFEELPGFQPVSGAEQPFDEEERHADVMACKETLHPVQRAAFDRLWDSAVDGLQSPAMTEAERKARGRMIKSIKACVAAREQSRRGPGPKTQ